LEVGGHMVVVVMIIQVVDRVGVVGKKKIEPRAGKRRKCASAGIAAGGAVHLAPRCAEVGSVGIKPDDAGETGNHRLVGHLVLGLYIAVVACLMIVGFVSVGMYVLKIYLEFECLVE